MVDAKEDEINQKPIDACLYLLDLYCQSSKLVYLPSYNFKPTLSPIDINLNQMTKSIIGPQRCGLNLSV